MTGTPAGPERGAGGQGQGAAARGPGAQPHGGDARAGGTTASAAAWSTPCRIQATLPQTDQKSLDARALDGGAGGASEATPVSADLLSRDSYLQSSAEVGPSIDPLFSALQLRRDLEDQEAATQDALRRAVAEEVKREGALARMRAEQVGCCPGSTGSAGAPDTPYGAPGRSP
jgi:hypothetical protein